MNTLILQDIVDQYCLYYVVLCQVPWRSALKARFSSFVHQLSRLRAIKLPHHRFLRAVSSKDFQELLA